MPAKSSIHSYNPLYLALKEQVSTENRIFRQKEDIYTTAITLIAEDCYTKKYIKDNVKYLVDKTNILIDVSNSLSHFKEAALVLGLAKIHGVGGVGKIERYINECLLNPSCMSIPPQALGAAGYLLVNANYQTSNFTAFQKALLNKLDSLVSNKNLNAVLDLAIGAKALNPSQKDWVSEQAKIQSDSLSLERISKLVIILDGDEFVSTLEEKLGETVGSVIYPDVSFSIFEAQKIINSNIPNTSMKNILAELKKVDTSWAKMITAMESEGITIDLAQLHKVPNFSPHQDVWAILGLQRANRIKTVQVDEKEYQDFVDYTSKTGENYRRLSMASTVTVVCIAVLQSLYVYYLFDTQSIGFQEALKNFSLEKYIFDIQSDYFAPINPWLQLGVAMIWIPTLLLRLFIKGHLTIASVVLSWPILLPFYEGGKRIKDGILK